MFSNVFSTIWSNPAYRILEKQIHGETVVLAENEGRLCAAKRVGNEFVSLVLSGIPTKVNTALDRALTYTRLKDSNLQLVGPSLAVLPRMKGGVWYGPFPRELLTNLEGLKKWFQQHPETTTLSSVNDLISTEEAVTLAAALPYSQVSKLCLIGTRIGSEGAKAIATALPHTRINWLELSSAQIGLDGIKALSEALPLSQVVNLELELFNIGSEGAKAIATALPHCRLSRLVLRNSGIEDAEAKELAAVLPYSLLLDLELQVHSISSDGMNALAAVLPFSWISKLNLGPSVTKLNAKALARILPLSRLSWLNLRNTKMQDKQGQAIVGALSSSSVTSLNLSRNPDIAEKTMEALATALPSYLLSHLYFDECNLKAKDIQTIVAALSRFQLTVLSLNRTAINADNVKALAAALPRSRIVRLNLDGIGLENEGLKSMAAVLPDTSLSQLTISDNDSVGDEGMIALAQILPKSQVRSLRLGKIGMNGLQALLAAVKGSQLSSLGYPCTEIELEIARQITSHMQTNHCRNKNFLKVCQVGTLAEVEQLLSQESLFHANDSNNTALHIAVKRNHRDLVALLLKHNAVLLPNDNNSTPLDLALKLGHHDLVELLEAGLPDAIPVPDPVPVPKDYYCSITREIMYDPVLLAGDGVTYEREAIEKWLQTSDLSPLHGSALASKLLIPNQFCKGQIQDLIEKHSHLEKETYIPEASKKACLTALAERNVNSLKDLLKDKRLLSVEFPNGLLIELACQSSLEMLKTVIEAYRARPHFSHELCAKAAQGLGAEGVSLLFNLLPKKVPTGLLPALFEAIKIQSGAYLQALIEMGVSPNSRDLRGSYPLHRTVEAGSKELITILMEHDANLKAVDREGRTSLQLAEQLGKLDLVRHIKQKKIEIKLRPLLAPIQEQINTRGRVIQQLRGALFETQTSLGNIVPLLGANPSLSSVTDELTALQKRINQHFS